MEIIANNKSFFLENDHYFWWNQKNDVSLQVETVFIEYGSA